MRHRQSGAGPLGFWRLFLRTAGTSFKRSGAWRGAERIPAARAAEAGHLAEKHKTMPPFRIYYSDGSRRDGSSQRDWENLPSSGVQVVCAPESPWNIHKWASEGTRLSPGDDLKGAKTPGRFAKGMVVGPPFDRHLFTGIDPIDPFGWGTKDGSLTGDAEYQSIWERARGDD